VSTRKQEPPPPAGGRGAVVGGLSVKEATIRGIRDGVVEFLVMDPCVPVEVALRLLRPSVN